MGMTLALGCYTNDPIRVPVALHGLRPVLSLPDDVNGYGLATCIDDHVVQKRVPMWPKNAELEQLMNNKRGGFSVLQVHRKSDISPRNVAGANQMGPYKLRRFAAAIGGGPVNGDEAMAEREQLYAKLPDFLRRSVQGHQSGEALFFTLLSHLSDLGLIDAPVVAPEVIKEIINDVVADLPGSGNRYITFTTGANIIHYNKGFRGHFLQVMGLTDQWADEVDPNFTDTSAARERLRHFRALFVHTISGNPHLQKELPDLGPVKITSLVEDGFWEIHRDFVLRQV